MGGGDLMDRNINLDAGEEAIRCYWVKIMRICIDIGNLTKRGMQADLHVYFHDCRRAM